MVEEEEARRLNRDLNFPQPLRPPFLMNLLRIPLLHMTDPVPLLCNLNLQFNRCPRLRLQRLWHLVPNHQKRQDEAHEIESGSNNYMLNYTTPTAWKLRYHHHQPNHYPSSSSPYRILSNILSKTFYINALHVLHAVTNKTCITTKAA